jgi:hypothetical protein
VGQTAAGNSPGDGLTYTVDDYDAGRYEQLRKNGLGVAAISYEQLRGIAAEILAAHAAGGLEEARGLLDLEAGPATPKVDVRAAVFGEEKILLVREPDDGGWSLPGGGPTSARARRRPPSVRSAKRPATGCGRRV